MSEPSAIVRYRVPAPGSAWIEDERMQMSLVVQAAGGEVPVQREKRIRRRVEVFGANPRIVTRARISYLEHAVIERRALAERTRPSPIAGKRYVLDATGGAVAVATDGGEAPADEAAAVCAEEKRFGKPETLAMVVAGLRYRVGEPVAVPPATAARLFPGDLEVTALELTLLEHGERDARFAIRLAMRGASAGVETRADAAGTLRVDADTAQPLEMKLVGPVHLTGAIVADGTLEIVATREPDPAWGN
ncbi:MAG: hypothetical protein E6J90_38575 [Deltaproteobacteria bacterium]|nr:MAG: hypothetical protein E6J91_32900 [Deltaproteobacteria bacterium]TMQ09170.1 MAG: hypothetical protein E6J90_38575 [Deltaproteobacteria bacterium]